MAMVSSHKSYRPIYPWTFRQVDRMKRKPADCKQDNVRDTKSSCSFVSLFAFGKFFSLFLRFFGLSWSTWWERRFASPALEHSFDDKRIAYQHYLKTWTNLIRGCDRNLVLFGRARTCQKNMTAAHWRACTPNIQNYNVITLVVSVKYSSVRKFWAYGEFIYNKPSMHRHRAEEAT